MRTLPVRRNDLLAGWGVLMSWNCLKTVFNIVSVLTIVGGLCSCAYDVEDVTVRRPRVRYQPIYDESLCVIPKNQGDDTISPREAKLVVSDFFGKRYDRSMLENVLTASAVATGRYVSELLEGRLYRIPRDMVPDARVCPMFTDLPVAPDDLRDLWDRFAGGELRKGLDGWRLAGLYFEDCGRDGYPCDDRSMVRPTILIDEGRDRWTLIHEMMHFNFSRERKLDPQMPPLSVLAREAAATKNAAKELLIAYKAKGERDLLSKLQAHSSWLLREWFYHIMVHTVLEEIAVEGLLLDEYLAKRLQNVSPDSLNIALKYMERTYEHMLMEYNTASIIKEDDAGLGLSLHSLRVFIYEEARKRNYKEILSEVQSDIAFFSRWQRSIEKLIERRRSRVRAYQRLHPFLPFLNAMNPLKPQLRPLALNTAGLELPAHYVHTPEWQLYQAWKD